MKGREADLNKLLFAILKRIFLSLESSIQYELPVAIEESSLTEPAIGQHAIDEQPPPLTFQIVEGASKRGQQKLIDSHGHSYCVKRRRNEIVYWHCSLRGKSNHCPASVIQRGREDFKVGIGHNHPGEVGLPETAKLTAAIKRKATDDLFRPASTIVDEVLLEDMGTNAALPTLPKPETLARAANRCRQARRPEPKSCWPLWTSLLRACVPATQRGPPGVTAYSACV